MRAMLGLIIVCFAAGAVRHGTDFLFNGPRPYAGAPLSVELFWSALLPLDLTVVALLLRDWRRVGLALALGVMVADVAVNSAVSWTFDVPQLGWALQLQSLFLGFLLGALPLLWPRAALSESMAAQP